MNQPDRPIIDIDDLDLISDPIDHEDITKVYLPNGHLIIGYLTADTDACDPLEDCDGMGMITHDVRPYLRQYPNGDAILYPYHEEARKKLEFQVRSRELICTQEDIDCRITLLGDESVRLINEISLEIRDKFVDDSLMILLSSNYIGQYRVESDKSKVTGIFLPDTELIHHLNSFPKDQQKTELLRHCHTSLEMYNLYKDGEVYGMITEVFDKHGNSINDSDAVWGLLGLDHAKEELAAFVAQKETLLRSEWSRGDPNQLQLNLE